MFIEILNKKYHSENLESDIRVMVVFKSMTLGYFNDKRLRL